MSASDAAPLHTWAYGTDDENASAPESGYHGNSSTADPESASDDDTGYGDQAGHDAWDEPQVGTADNAPGNDDDAWDGDQARNDGDAGNGTWDGDQAGPVEAAREWDPARTDDDADAARDGDSAGTDVDADTDTWNGDQAGPDDEAWGGDHAGDDDDDARGETQAGNGSVPGAPSSVLIALGTVTSNVATLT